MARSDNNLNAVFQDTADAIRDKTGGSAEISPRDFADEIAAIPTGGSGTVPYFTYTSRWIQGAGDLVNLAQGAQFNGILLSGDSANGFKVNILYGSIEATLDVGTVATGEGNKPFVRIHDRSDRNKIYMMLEPAATDNSIRFSETMSVESVVSTTGYDSTKNSLRIFS